MSKLVIDSVLTSRNPHAPPSPPFYFDRWGPLLLLAQRKRRTSRALSTTTSSVGQGGSKTSSHATEPRRGTCTIRTTPCSSTSSRTKVDLCGPSDATTVGNSDAATSRIIRTRFPRRKLQQQGKPPRLLSPDLPPPSPVSRQSSLTTSHRLPPCGTASCLRQRQRSPAGSPKTQAGGGRATKTTTTTGGRRKRRRRSR